MIEQKQLFELGRVIKTHGLKGQILVSIDSDNLDHYTNITALQIGKSINEYKVYHIEDISIKTNGTAYIKLIDIQSIDNAQELVGMKIYLPTSDLPRLQKGKYYLHDLAGCQIYNEKNEPLGIVESANDFPGQTMLTVNIAGRSVLIPFVPEFFPEIDIINKKLIGRIPDGLLDLNK